MIPKEFKANPIALLSQSDSKMESLRLFPAGPTSGVGLPGYYA